MRAGNFSGNFEAGPFGLDLVVDIFHVVEVHRVQPAVESAPVSYFFDGGSLEKFKVTIFLEAFDSPLPPLFGKILFDIDRARGADFFAKEARNTTSAEDRRGDGKVNGLHGALIDTKAAFRVGALPSIQGHGHDEVF